MTARAALLLALLVGGCDRPGEEILVFAAASMTDVAEETAARVERETGQSVVVSVGSTADLARQIERGAPADVLLAADPAWVQYVRDRTDAVVGVRGLGRGRLVVVGPRGTPKAASVADGLGAAQRIALGDPSHVPAGAYARRALIALDEWDAVEPRVVPTSDVRAALAAVETGAAERGIVYASDATVSDRVAVVYRFDPSASGEIVYQAAWLGSERGRPFVEALTDSLGRVTLARGGFDPAMP